jgi:NAD(P)-dependent dehydrogenase (short-subunit alcohol dehydrogenase family)
MADSKVFFITGCSSGFGKALVHICLRARNKVVATSRNLATLYFDRTNSSNFFANRLGVRSLASIKAAFNKATKIFS